MPQLPLATRAPAALMWATSEDAAPDGLVALAAARVGKGVVGPTRVLTVPAWGARSKDKTVRVAGYTPG